MKEKSKRNCRLKIEGYLIHLSNHKLTHLILRLIETRLLRFLSHRFYVYFLAVNIYHTTKKLEATSIQ